METAAMSASEASSATGQYLTFALGDEQYGVELLKVQEIKGYSPVTPIPNTPAHIKGVLNLRGSVVPVLDLRTRFGMEQIEYTKFNVIIVINIGSRVIGLLVDSVSDVLNVGPGDLRPVPDFGNRTDTRFISGMASAGEKIAVLLQIESLLSDADLAVAEQVEAEHSEEDSGVEK